MNEGYMYNALGHPNSQYFTLKMLNTSSPCIVLGSPITVYPRVATMNSLDPASTQRLEPLVAWLRISWTRLFLSTILYSDHLDGPQYWTSIDRTELAWPNCSVRCSFTSVQRHTVSPMLCRPYGSRECFALTGKIDSGHSHEMFTYGALNIANGHCASPSSSESAPRHACDGLGVVPPSLDEIPLSAQTAQAASEMHMVDGYLRRRGRHLKSWRRRYFTFEDGILVHKKNDEQSARIIHEDRVFDVMYWSGRPYGLCMKLRGDRLVFLTARSEEDAARWHDTIESFLTEQRCVVDLRRALCRGRLPSIRESVSELARAD